MIPKGYGPMFHVEHCIEKFLPKTQKDSAISKLQFIEKEYFKWNRHINISSVRDADSFWIKHILDSLCLVQYICEKGKGKDVFDIGSGGGFPGLVLALFLENKIKMFEPIKKKTDFIEHCILRLKLNNAEVFTQRYQDIQNIQENSLIVSRALGNYQEMCKYFIDINPGIEIILMSTKKESEKLKGLTVELFSDSYNFINDDLEKPFKNNVLVKVTK